MPVQRSAINLPEISIWFHISLWDLIGTWDPSKWPRNMHLVIPPSPQNQNIQTRSQHWNPQVCSFSLFPNFCHCSLYIVGAQQILSKSFLNVVPQKYTEPNMVSGARGIKFFFKIWHASSGNFLKITSLPEPKSFLLYYKWSLRNSINEKRLIKYSKTVTGNPYTLFTFNIIPKKSDPKC